MTVTLIKQVTTYFLCRQPHLLVNDDCGERWYWDLRAAPATGVSHLQSPTYPFSQTAAVKLLCKNSRISFDLMHALCSTHRCKALSNRQHLPIFPFIFKWLTANSSSDPLSRGLWSTGYSFKTRPSSLLLTKVRILARHDKSCLWTRSG